MKLILNEDILQHLIHESRHRFTKIEAFEFLYSTIAESEEGAFHTSFNRLAQAWNWDYHQVSEFIFKLAELNIIAMQHTTASLVLYFASEFSELSEALSPLFSLLSLKWQKADKMEAFFHIIGKLMLNEGNKETTLSIRSLAKELGWSHHTVFSLLHDMMRNGIISKSSETNGSNFILQGKNIIH